LALHDGPAAWVRLAETPGVGRETARKLLAVFGLPENIFSASHKALCEVVPERIADSLTEAPSADLQNLIARTLAWMAAPGNRMVTLADADYPPLLLNIPDPPLLFYAKGDVALLAEQSVAIVGSRNATAQGKQNAERFAASLSASGFHTVSGMALGIELADSVLSYDLRHAGILAPAPVLEMLLADPGNPRSLAYQCNALRSCLERLGADDDAAASQALLTEAVNLAGATSDLQAPLSNIGARLRLLSDRVHRRFFTLLPEAHQLEDEEEMETAS